jgi:hypothetical protein
MHRSPRRLVPWVVTVVVAAAVMVGVGIGTGWFEGSSAPDGPGPVPTSDPGEEPTVDPTVNPTVTVSPPDARAVPVESLLRADTVAIDALYRDLDGDGVEEIVLVSRSTTATDGLPRPFLDVYAWTGAAFQNVLDATEGAPVGEPEAPLLMLGGEIGGINQVVQFVDLIDFFVDGTPQLVVGILNVGASAGPLEIWVISGVPGAEGAASFQTEFYEATTRGGELTREADRLLLDTGAYAPNDPGCCPSRIEHQVIGLLEGESIGILERTFAPAEVGG